MAYIWTEEASTALGADATFSQYAMALDPAFSLSSHVQAS